ncbi:hypothetical protein PR048_023133 [Dryococelus australis]|uniref:DUF5641 domain-containing protein n=1 Tax=Dryococelus australis TaxID=614101 RepID=A0ABQ9GTA7_9NEOP|nr:hypothetical protein PR048_023133 [Dryococelus australis]
MSALTPNHFLNIDFPQVLSDKDVTSNPRNRLHLCLHQLQQKEKQSSGDKSVAERQLIHIKYPNLLLLRWCLTRIVKVFPGKDGVMQVVEGIRHMARCNLPYEVVSVMRTGVVVLPWHGTVVSEPVVCVALSATRTACSMTDILVSRFIKCHVNLPEVRLCYRPNSRAYRPRSRSSIMCRGMAQLVLKAEACSISRKSQQQMTPADNSWGGSCQPPAPSPKQRARGQGVYKYVCCPITVVYASLNSDQHPVRV